MEDSEEDEEDSLEYETDAPLQDSYMTPPSTGGCSEPSPQPSQSPTPEGSNPEPLGAWGPGNQQKHLEYIVGTG